jgi:MFS family permease
MNGLQALVEWQTFMNNPTGAYLGGIVAIQAAGSCFGYPIMSVVASKWGRKSSVYVGCAVILFGVILQTAARTPAMFIVSRFFVGSASGFFGSVPILITETAYPTHRGKMTAGYNTLYYVGSLIAAWATFGTRNLGSNWTWRIPSLLQIAVPVLMLPFFITCPESPRWLIAAGRVEEARKIFVKYHAGGDERSPLVEFEMAEVEQALSLERSAKNQASYSYMFRTKGNRHRLFITVTMGIFGQWDGSGIVSTNAFSSFIC